MNTIKPYGKSNYIPPDEALRQIEEIPIDETPADTPIAEERSAPTITDAGRFLKLEHIVCIGSDGKVFEEHPRIFLEKYHIKNEDEPNEYLYTGAYEAIAHLEQKGMFLPSMAMTCNILAALYARKDSMPEARKLLDQYNSIGNYLLSGHHQNTVVCPGTIIHYPYDKDFRKSGGDKGVNANLRIQKTFKYRREWCNGKDLYAADLDEALKEEDILNYVKDLTGLEDPNILVEIGKYLEMRAVLYMGHENDSWGVIDINRYEGCWRIAPYSGVTSYARGARR